MNEKNETTTPKFTDIAYQIKSYLNELERNLINTPTRDIPINQYFLHEPTEIEDEKTFFSLIAAFDLQVFFRKNFYYCPSKNLLIYVENILNKNSGTNFIYTVYEINVENDKGKDNCRLKRLYKKVSVFKDFIKIFESDLLIVTGGDFGFTKKWNKELNKSEKSLIDKEKVNLNMEKYHCIYTRDDEFNDKVLNDTDCVWTKGTYPELIEVDENELQQIKHEIQLSKLGEQ
jgi:hypothetical protein